jgi:xanthine dehydrogenase accessory factor
MTPDILAELLAAQTAGRALVLATRLPDGAQRLLCNDDAQRLLCNDGAQRIVHNDNAAQDPLAQAAATALAEDKSRRVEIDGESWFLAVQAPPHRLLIIGAVHIAQALAPLAALAGLAVSIIDPRRGFATAERFPATTLINAWPDEALAAIAPDTRTAIVTLTHDSKLDDPALDLALRSPAFFVGALGSRRTHASRLARLAELGHPPEALARLRGPVGLPLGAVTAPEIAVSILAEIIAARRGAALGRRA